MKPNRARELRERIPLTREVVAVRAGLSSSTVRLAELGVITRRTAEKLAEVLGCAPEELLAGGRS